MDKKTRYGILILAVIIIGGAIFYIESVFYGGNTGVLREPSGGGQGQQGTDIGQLAPDFELETFDGERLRFSDFGGHALIVNAWAGWCPFCIDEIPDLQKASDKYGDDVTVLFVHRSRTESIDIGRTYLNNFPETRGIAVTDPVLQDPRDDFYNTFFGFGMPVTLFLDKDGIIRDKKVGPLTVEEIEEKIQKII